jgi:hypothetical protein
MSGFKNVLKSSKCNVICFLVTGTNKEPKKFVNGLDMFAEMDVEVVSDRYAVSY